MNEVSQRNTLSAAIVALLGITLGVSFSGVVLFTVYKAVKYFWGMG